MKKGIALLLMLALLLPAAAIGTDFAASDISDARRKALDVFRLCAYSAEYGDGRRDFLVRWEKPVRICTAGNPTREDLQTLDRFILELGMRVPCLPPVTRTNSQSQADIVMHFCPLREMGARVPDYREGNWGYFTFRYSSYRINQATIAIATDVTNQLERNHLIQEELVGALGLANDHRVYADSILYQEWTTVQRLSEVDWLMLNFLYSPLVKPGDKWTTTERALRKFYGF